MNDEKNSIGDQQILNFHIDQSKSKNANKLQKMVQHADSFSESLDNMKNGTEKKTNENHTKRQKSLCYDFKKGNCRRRFCRYPHAMSFDQVVFCHDFQNNGCFRNNCKFIHRSIEDEEHYRQYGVYPLPQERQTAAAPPQQQPPPPPDGHHMNGLPPPQMNFYSNRENAMIANQHSGQIFQPNNNNNNNNNSPMICRRRSFGMSDNDQGIPAAKRQHIDDLQCQNGYMDPNLVNQPNQINVSSSNVQNSVPAPVQSNMQAPVISAPQPPPPPPQLASVMIGEDVINIFRLYEEHNLLRRRVDINEERLQDLRATNTFLLQQNEQLRRQTRCSCTSTIVNPVTLTTATQPSAGTQVLNAVSIAPVQVQATPIVSIASIAGQPQTQIIASSGPLALSANTTQGQQLALASTGQTVQILGTPQITPASAPSMGITMNTSQPLTMSANATQPIISYPIMTHSILPH